MLVVLLARVMLILVLVLAPLVAMRGGAAAVAVLRHHAGFYSNIESIRDVGTITPSTLNDQPQALASL